MKENDTNQGFGEGAEEVVRRARAVGAEVSGLVEAVGAVAQTARQAINLEQRMKESPAKTLLIAAGVGYIAGGGFFTPFTGTMLRLGTRLWLIPTIRNTIINSTQEFH